MIPSDDPTSQQVASKRFQPDRLKLTHSVQLRDAAPLVELESNLKNLCEDLNAKAAAIFLSVEEDVPIAVVGAFSPSLFNQVNMEKVIFDGEMYDSPNYCAFPIVLNHLTVGYLAVKAGRLSETRKKLCYTHAQLAAKELELANQTAELQYQNEQISRKQKQLEQAISFKNNILSLTTHDLRSPLNAVNGFLELMELHFSGETKPELIDFHKKIQSGLSNVSDLVDQLHEIALLELERMELSLVKVDVNWLIQEVCDVLQGPCIAKKHSLKLVRSERPIHVEVDIPKAKRIFFNLIGNAIKYTPTGGKIEVTLFQDKSTAHISVSDNGIGIPKDKQVAIFEPFHKIQKAGTSGESATGLGLFVSNYFAQLFKGSISVESEQGKGSDFTVHLPALHMSF